MGAKIGTDPIITKKPGKGVYPIMPYNDPYGGEYEPDAGGGWD